VIPYKYQTDGIHIAITTVYEIDMILSYNFKHIVKRKTIKMTDEINSSLGYKKIEIYTPEEVVEDEQ